MAVVTCKSANHLQQFFPVFIADGILPTPPPAMLIPNTLHQVGHAAQRTDIRVVGIVVDASIKVAERLFLTSIIVAGTIRLHLNGTDHTLSGVQQDDYLSYVKDGSTVRWKRLTSTDSDVKIARVLTIWKSKTGAARIELEVAVLPQIHQCNQQPGAVKDVDNGNVLQNITDAKANAQCKSFVKHCALFLDTDEVFYSSMGDAYAADHNIMCIPSSILNNRRLWGNRRSNYQFVQSIGKGPIYTKQSGPGEADICLHENDARYTLHDMFYKDHAAENVDVLREQDHASSTIYTPGLSESQQAAMITAIAKTYTDEEIRILTIGW